MIKEPATQNHALRRLASTLLALSLPIIVATFLSGSFFKLSTLEPGSVFDAQSAQAAPAQMEHHNMAGMSGMMDMKGMEGMAGMQAPARETESETRTPQVTGTAQATGTAQTTETAQATGTGTVLPTGTPGSAVQIYMQSHDTFSPREITISVGTTVRWTNGDEEDHTSTSDSGLWNSGVLHGGQSFDFVFTQPGDYHYTCLIHGAQMDGWVHVTGTGWTPTPQPSTTPQGGTVDVDIQNFAFGPQTINVLPGTTVRWTNRDSSAHTTASDTGLWNSGDLAPNQTFSFTFNTAGTFTYHCDRHPGMHGTINVVMPGTTTPQVTQTAQTTQTAQATATASGQATTTPSAGMAYVNIQSYAYSPSSITVQAGTTVRWTNLDNDRHSVTSDSGLFDSGVFTQNQTFDFTFNTPGTYTYICSVHGAFMTGHVVVTAGGVTQTPGTTNTPAATQTSAPASTATAQPSHTAQPSRTATPRATNTPAVATVNIQNYAYSPNSLTVQAGTTVHWTNLDNDNHTVTSIANPPLFNSGVIAPNGTWQHTFSVPGSYTYFCMVHGTFMEGTITVVAAPTATSTPAPGQLFSDVTPNDYFYTPVNWLANHSVISGYQDGTFRPYNNTTRGQLTKIVVLAEGWAINTAGAPHFSDVGTDNAFYGYIETAFNHGIISGYADGTFRWGNNVTRGQLSKIVVLAEGWASDTTGGPHFSDVGTDNTFYGYIETAFNHGIISGYADHTFRPGNPATRGQIAKIVYNAVTQP